MRSVLMTDYVMLHVSSRLTRVLSVCTLCAFYGIHALHAVNAAVTHGTAGTDMLHGAAGIAADNELRGQQNHCHANNSQCEKQYF